MIAFSTRNTSRYKAWSDSNQYHGDFLELPSSKHWFDKNYKKDGIFLLMMSCRSRRGIGQKPLKLTHRFPKEGFV